MAQETQKVMEDVISSAYDLGVDHSIAIVNKVLGHYPGLVEGIIRQLNELKNKEA